MTKTLREEVLKELIMAKLGGNRETNGQTIDVVVVEGEVVLLGWCDFERQRRAAEDIARGTYGVRSVVDKVQVRRISQSI